MGLRDWWRRIWGSERRAERALGEELDHWGDRLRLLIGTTPPRRGSAALLKAFAEHPWLHAVTERRADAVSSVEWVLYRRPGRRRARALPGSRSRHAVGRRRSLDMLLAAGELKRVEEHPLLDLLWEPNPVHTGVAYWRLLSLYRDLLGEAFSGLGRASPSSRPSELWPIPPTWVTDTPAPDRPYYVVKPTGAQSSTPRAEDVWWMRQFDPADPYRGRGVGTAGALGDELETDEYMAVMAKSRFYNRALPEVIIGLIGAAGVGGNAGPGKQALDKFTEELKAAHRGPTRAGQGHVVPGDVRVQHLGFNMVENQYVQGREFLRNTSMQVFGTPPEILGVLDNANRSTIDAADYLFAKHSTEPVLEAVRAELEAKIVPLFGGDLWLDYISPVPADFEAERELIVALPGAFRVNEIRAVGGRGPLDGPEGEALYKAPGAPAGEVEQADADRALLPLPDHEPDLASELRGVLTEGLGVH